MLKAEMGLPLNCTTSCFNLYSIFMTCDSPLAVVMPHTNTNPNLTVLCWNW